VLGAFARNRRIKNHLPNFLALMCELFTFLGVLGLEDRRGLVVNDRCSGTARVVLAFPIPILRKPDHTIAHQKGLVQFVRDDDQCVGRQVTAARFGPVLFVQREEKFLQVFAGRFIQRAERLVQQNDFRFHDQRLRERHALAHATGHLVRIKIQRIGQFHALQHRFGFGEMLLSQTPPPWPLEDSERKRSLIQHQTYRDILQRREKGIEGVLLVNDAAIPPRSFDHRTIGIAGLPHENRALMRWVGAEDGAQESGLTTAARTDERKKLSARYLHFHFVQHPLGAEPVAHVLTMHREIHGLIPPGVVPRTEFSLQPAKQKIHRETEASQQREIRIDHAHVEKL